MSDKVASHLAVYQKFFDAFNEMVWEKIESSLRELTTPNFILHRVSKPEKEMTLDEYFDIYKPIFENLSYQRITVENSFSAANMVALNVIIEITNKHTNEKTRQEVFFIDRFDGCKLAEEWEWVWVIP